MPQIVYGLVVGLFIIGSLIGRFGTGKYVNKFGPKNINYWIIACDYNYFTSFLDQSHS